MAWWSFGLGQKPPHVSRETKTAIEKKSLTAAATTVRGTDRSFLPATSSWQNEVWGYYDNLGEYQYAVDWKSRMMSRVRIYAARVEPGQDEPIRLEDDSLPVRLVSSIGVSSQTAILDDLSTQLDVPGEGFVIVENVNGSEVWSVRSIDEIRKRGSVFETISEDIIDRTQNWRPLAEDHIIMRVFRPHKRFHNVANSTSRAARSTMRELELVNRHIISQYLSRLASAGIVIFPEEISFPVREEFADQPDPFMAEWIEIAAKAISEPGTASAVIPIPMRIPGEWLGKVQHLDFTLKIDEKIIEKRESVIRRLATQINIPAEILTGMGAVNHWGAWQLEEGALKTTISPDVELICSALTSQYLQPRLAASGVEDANQFVIWYDMSELTIRPDRSGNAFQAYDRLEISGSALRRETGFDDSDEPDKNELKEQGLKIILKQSSTDARTALSELLGEEAPITPGPPVGEAPTPVEEPPEDERIEPGTQTDVPDAATMRTDRLIAQSRSPHGIRFTVRGRWELLHPSMCEKHAYTCPYTHAALGLRTFPGRSGLYECSLDTFGRLLIGDMAPHMDTSCLLVTRGGNGNSK